MNGNYVKGGLVLRSLVLIVGLVGCGSAVAAFLYSVREALPQRDTASLPPVVGYIHLEPENVTEWFVGYGRVKPDRASTLAAEVSGTVAELVGDIEVGSEIKEHDPLIRLNTREYGHALDQARAATAMDQALIDELAAEAGTLVKLVATAEQEVRVTADERARLADLFERGLAAKKEFDFATLAYQQARRILQGYEMEIAKIDPQRARLEASKRSHEAAERMAELNVERCVVSAPFGGRIETLFVEAGDYVSPGSFLLKLIDPARVEIAVQLPASTYFHVALGAPCLIRCESMPDVSWHGMVGRIAPSVDERSRTFSVYVEVDNATQSLPLVPGIFVTARVRGPVHQDRILVPRSALRNGSVLVVGDAVASRRSVTMERLVGERAIIRGNVHAGDRLIVSHLTTLRDGSAIRINAELSSSSSEDTTVLDDTSALP